MQNVFLIDPPKPHSPKQAMIMQAFMHPGIEEIWVACGTKFGKTLAAATAQSMGVLSKPRGIYRWVAPIYTQSKIGYNYCRQILPPPPHVKLNTSSLEISVPSLDSMIQFYHAQNPESLEGYGIAGYVFDEAAKIKEAAYHAAKTTVTVTRGPMLFCSTPWGKNWFHRKCMAAREEMARAKHEGRIPKQIFIRARTMDNPSVPKESIEAARKALSARLFRQYYEAEFEDEGSVFTGYRKCLYTPELDVYGDDQIWISERAKDATVVVGADWAKTQDYCVFFAVELSTRRVLGFQRFHKQPYTESIRRLVRFCRKFKETEIVYHDKTGVGQAIDDQLSYTDLRYHGVNFTNSSKAEMVNKLITSFEQGHILVPTWPTLIQELESFEVQQTESGNLRYGAAGDGHDDTVCALLLAHAALIDYSDRQRDLDFLEDLKPRSLSALEAYYSELSDD